MGHSGEYPARIHRPRHKKQRLTYAGKLIGCTDTCLAMYADAVTFGAVNVTESWVRAHSTEPKPDPASPGLNIPQLLEVARNDLHIKLYDGTGGTWAGMLARLNENRRVIAQLWYADIGGNAIGHAMLLQAGRARPGAPAGLEILGNDPMKTAEAWYVDDRVRRAMESFGRRTGLASGRLRYAYSDKLRYVAEGAT